MRPAPRVHAALRVVQGALQDVRQAYGHRAAVRDAEEAGELIAHGVARGGLRLVDGLAGEVGGAEHVLVGLALVVQAAVHGGEDQANRAQGDGPALRRRAHGPGGLDPLAQGVEQRALLLVEGQGVQRVGVQDRKVRQCGRAGDGALFAVHVDDGKVRALAAGSGGRGHGHERHAVLLQGLGQAVLLRVHARKELDALAHVQAAAAADGHDRVAALCTEGLHAAEHVLVLRVGGKALEHGAGHGAGRDGPGHAQMGKRRVAHEEELAHAPLL